MTTPKPTWEDRDLPTLRAIVEIIEETGQEEAERSAVVARTGFDEATVDRAIAALSHGQPPFFVRLDAVLGLDWSVMGVTERARRAVGLWPTPEDLADRLVIAFNRAADQADNPEQKTRLRRAAEAIGGVTRDALVNIAVDVMMRQSGI